MILIDDCGPAMEELAATIDNPGVLVMQSAEFIRLKRFSHAAIGVRDLHQQVAFYVGSLTLEKVIQQQKHLYLRAADDQHHVLELVAGHSGLHHIAFEVIDDEELDRAKYILTKHGIVLIQEPVHGLEPGIGRLLRFRDWEGNVIELVSDVALYAAEKTSEKGGGLSLDHVTFYTGNTRKQESFYARLFGMRVSDRVPGLLTFLTSGTNHHCLGFLALPRRGVHHIAFNYANEEQMMKAMIQLGDAGFKRADGPGRHGPGASLYVYFEDSEKNLVELVTDNAYVDDPLREPGIWSQPDAFNLWKVSSPMGPPPAMHWMVHLMPTLARLVRRN